MNTDTRFEQVDLTNCDREPIHIPGSIQPHGMLLGIRPETGIVEVVSANCASFVGVAPASLLGQPLAAVLEGESHARTRRVQDIPDMIGLQNVQVMLPQSGSPVYEGILHRSGGLDILELEPYQPAGDGFLLSFYQVYNRKLYQLQDARNIDELFQRACRMVKELTGFERIWLYQFDPDWNGAIVAEEREPHLESYLGLHYPASDIPKQARALYLRNRLRFIVDVHAVPVPLVPDHNPVAGGPLDLSMAVLRSISPIHIEYLQNMGVTATMTISLIRDNTLIGLISCHDHRGPRFVPFEMRRACEFVGFAVSQALSEIQARQRSRIYLQGAARIEAINRQLKDESALHDVLLQGRPNLLDLIPCQGGAIVHGGKVRTAGLAPPADAIGELVEWLQANVREDLFVTNRLAQHYPAGEVLADTAAGLCAFNLSPEGEDWVLWFRSEVVQTVCWGGDPYKTMTEDPATGRIHPRKSFAKWKEEVRGTSPAWDADEVAAIRPFWNDLMQFMRQLDLEEQRRMDQRLKEAQKLESLGILAGGVAHDLNNLLSPIIGYSELMLDEQMDAAEQRSALEEVLRAGSTSRDLVRQLLAFSRKQALLCKPLDLNRVILGFRNLLRRTIKEDVDVRFLLHPHLADVFADSAQIEQVLMNLAINGAAAMPQGGTLTIETAMADLNEEFAARHPEVVPGRYVMLVVRDSGCGIEPEVLDNIFEPFFTTRGELGTGLGLATVHGIVHQHGGTIQVHSEAGVGTTFTVYLPVNGHGSRMAEAEGPVIRDLQGTETILLVEDSVHVRKLAHTILKRQGYRVLVAENGERALEVLQEHDGPVHLLLTDVIMPGMNGRALFERVAEMHPEIRVVYMSGYTGNVIAQRGVLDEGVQFIAKPFSVKQLASRIQEVLGKGAGREEGR